LQTKPDPAAPALLDVRNLKVHFSLRGSFLQRMLGHDTGSVKAVDGVTFTLQRGEVLGLVGESGSGKTTLSRAVLSLVKVTGGSIALNGQTISGLSERQFRPLRKRLQLIFQDPHASLNPAMPILDAVGHPLRIHHIAKSDDEVRRLVSESLERVGLVPVERFLRKYPSDLSGGQKQRAVLARAIILGPELVIADEPVSMLDMSVRAKVLELMGDLKRDLGLTYLYVTHDLATARYFCDRIAIMYLGRIIEIGSAAEIYTNPRHPYTKALLEAIPEPDPSHHVPHDLPRGEVPDAAVPPLGCSFHPRCPRAFSPCGWESRDLRLMLDERWATLTPDEYLRERAIVGDLKALDSPSTEAHIPAAKGHAATELTALLAELRKSTPEDPFWRGVVSVEPQANGVTVRFHDHVTPELQPVVDVVEPVEVACHLYRPDLVTH
jgi:oligopeptide/dipeptide ABC transporter ATP-binding protein